MTKGKDNLNGYPSTGDTKVGGIDGMEADKIIHQAEKKKRKQNKK